MVTGASSGIGAALARALAERGWRLVLVSRRTGLLGALAAECSERGAFVTTVVGDVADPAVAAAVAMEVNASHEVAWTLVNNAGGAWFGPVEQTPVGVVDDLVGSNLVGLIAMTQAVLPAMLDAGQGSVVNVLSLAATTDLPGCAVYAATKAGARQYGRNLALEVRSRGVRVTNVLPGATETPLWDGVALRPSGSAMMPVKAVVDALLWLLELPADRSIDELVLTPPAGASRNVANG